MQCRGLRLGFPRSATFNTAASHNDVHDKDYREKMYRIKYQISWRTDTAFLPWELAVME